MNRFLGSLLAITLVLRATSARGQEDPAGRDARVLFDEGLALVNAAKIDGDRAKYESARRKFLASYELGHHPHALDNLAVTEVKLGRWTDAIHHFRQLLRDSATDGNTRQKATEYIAKLSASVASVDIIAPAGAEIAVDGAATGDLAPLPDPLDLAPGHHTIEARRAGWSDARGVDLAPGTHTMLAFETPLSPVVPSRSVATAPSVASAPERPISLPTEANGAHSSTARTWTLVGLGAGAIVAAGTGIGFLVGANAAANLESSEQGGGPAYRCTGQLSQPCNALHNDAQAAADRRAAETGAFVVAGGLAAAFAVTFFAWPGSSRTMGAMRLAPAIGPKQGALVMQGSF